MANIGQAIGNFLHFDPTPGFNLANGGSASAYPAATGTRNFLGAPAKTPTTYGPGILARPASAPAPASNVAADTGSGYYTGAASGSYSGGTGGGAAAPVNNTGSLADVAAYQDQVNSLQQLLSSLDTTRTNQTQKYEQGFNNNLARLNEDQSNVLGQYATQRQDTGNDYQKNQQAIRSNARTGYNSLQALLGGIGSASDIVAPRAVINEAGRQSNGAADVFAKNLRGLQDAETAANTQYSRNKQDLESQKNNGLQSLIQSIDSQRQQYLGQLSGAQNQLRVAQGGSYATPTANNSEISRLLAEQAALPSRYADPTLTVKDINAAPVDLSSFQAQAAQLGGTSNTPDTNLTDDSASALAQLLKLQDQNTNQYTY